MPRHIFTAAERALSRERMRQRIAQERVNEVSSEVSSDDDSHSVQSLRNLADNVLRKALSGKDKLLAVRAAQTVLMADDSDPARERDLHIEFKTFDG